MCLPLDETAVLCWLQTQLRVIEAWREELAARPDADLQQITRLEQHYQWLSAETAAMDRTGAAA